MNRGRFLLFLLFFMGCSLYETAGQKAYKVEEVPNVQLQDATLFVSDPDDYLSTDEEQKINRLLQTLRQTKGVEVAVVVLSDIDTETYGTARAFATELFAHWQLGRKGQDDGLLVLQLVEGREIVFETGYGLEPFLPDALCKEIQTTLMVPHLKEGKIGEGLYVGVAEVAKVLEGTSELPHLGAQKTHPSSELRLMNIPWQRILPLWGMLGVGYFLYVLFSLIALRKRSDWYSHMRAKELMDQATWVNLIFFIWFLPIWGLFYWLMRGRLLPKVVCRHCGAKGQFQPHTAPRRSGYAHGVLASERVASFRCAHCGSVEQVKYRYQPLSFLVTLFYILHILSSSSSRGGFGGGRGGGGYSGGSWGGGSSGGGGSSTRY